MVYLVMRMASDRDIDRVDKLSVSNGQVISWSLEM
jgi:hypothetical protein